MEKRFCFIGRNVIKKTFQIVLDKLINNYLPSTMVPF